MLVLSFCSAVDNSDTEGKLQLQMRVRIEQVHRIVHHIMHSIQQPCECLAVVLPVNAAAIEAALPAQLNNRS